MILATLHLKNPLDYEVHDDTNCALASPSLIKNRGIPKSFCGLALTNAPKIVRKYSVMK